MPDEYLCKVEAYLGKPIVRLNADRGFDHWLDVYNGYLPSSRMRWCTRLLKIRPFERYVGDEPVVSYIGIRADENREGYISTKPNITARYPFKEDGIVKADVFRILVEALSGSEVASPPSRTMALGLTIPPSLLLRVDQIINPNPKITA